MMLEAVIGLGLLALFFGFLIAYASKKFKIEESQKLKEVEKALPGLNCGACGFANCKALAEAIIKGEASVDGCKIGGKKTADKLSKVLKNQNFI